MILSLSPSPIRFFVCVCSETLRQIFNFETDGKDNCSLSPSLSAGPDISSSDNAFLGHGESGALVGSNAVGAFL